MGTVDIVHSPLAGARRDVTMTIWHQAPYPLMRLLSIGIPKVEMNDVSNEDRYLWVIEKGNMSSQE